MTRKIARQSETTPLKTIDEYLWNERLGVAQLPDIMPGTTPSNTSSLPPDPSAAPDVNYDASVPGSQNDMFGSGVNSSGQPIAPKAPNTTPASVPATGKVAGVSTLYGDVNPTPTTGESGNDGSQANRNNSSENLPNGPDSGAPAGSSAAAAGEEAGGAGLASDLGEAATLALASKHWVGSVLDPIHTASEEPPPIDWEKVERGRMEGATDGLNPSDLKDIDDRGIALKDYTRARAYSSHDEILDAHDRGMNINEYDGPRRFGASHNQVIDAYNHGISLNSYAHARIRRIPHNEIIDAQNNGLDLKQYSNLRNVSHEEAKARLMYPRNKEASMNWESRFAGKDDKEEGHYKYIKKRGDKYVIIQKGTGKVLSTHDSREKAIASFKAMEMSKHGG